MSDDPAQIGDTQGSNLASDSSTNAQNVASYLPNLPLSSRRLLSQALRGRNLEDLNLNELSQILNDIELLIKDLSEELVSDLGIRDELEYEKELKNTFISLLLSIQSRRRACSTDSGGTHSSSSAGKKFFGLDFFYCNLLPAYNSNRYKCIYLIQYIVLIDMREDAIILSFCCR